MSLSTLLREADVRKRFAAEFRKPRIVLQGSICARPPSPTRAGLIGTALDYVLRLHVSILNRSARERQWVAETALGRLRLEVAARRQIFVPGSNRSTRGVVQEAEAIAREARAEYEHCRKRRRVTPRMIRYAVLLAQLDTFYRCGRLSEDFGTVRGTDTADLRRMLTIAEQLPASPFLASRICILNPAFNDASVLVRGADADVLVDDALIDFKATKHLNFTAEMFRQLVGYYALFRMSGITGAGRPRPRIRQLGIYFARFGICTCVPVDGCVDSATFGRFVRWFRERAGRGWPTTTITTADGTTVTF